MSELYCDDDYDYEESVSTATHIDVSGIYIESPIDTEYNLQYVDNIILDKINQEYTKNTENKDADVPDTVISSAASASASASAPASAPAPDVDDNELNVKHLVISAGGPAGGIIFGALGYLHRNNKWNINKIKSIYSCSVGSVLSILVSLKYDWDTLDDFMMKRPWSKIFSQSSPSSAISSYTPSYVYDMKYKFDAFMKIQSNKGIYGIKEFKESFRPAFEGKDYDTNMTMLEFYNATGIEHHFYTTELNKFESIDLSYKTYPNLPIIEACYMSCTYPIIFQPIIRNGCAYVDGALINDYPIDNCIRDQKCDINEIFGFKMLWETKPINISEKTSFIKFMTLFVNQIKTNFYDCRKTTPIPNEVLCMSKEQSFDDWKNIINDENYRRELLSRGVMYAKMFLSYRNNHIPQQQQQQ